MIVTEMRKNRNFMVQTVVCMDIKAPPHSLFSCSGPIQLCVLCARGRAFIRRLPPEEGLSTACCCCSVADDPARVAAPASACFTGGAQERGNQASCRCVNCATVVPSLTILTERIQIVQQTIAPPAPQAKSQVTPYCHVMTVLMLPGHADKAKLAPRNDLGGGG